MNGDGGDRHQGRSTDPGQCRERLTSILPANLIVGSVAASALLSVGEQVDIRSAAGRMVLNMDAATIRWEHVDFEARTPHRPNPKGDRDRAFTIPGNSGFP